MVWNEARIIKCSLRLVGAVNDNGSAETGFSGRNHIPRRVIPNVSTPGWIDTHPLRGKQQDIGVGLADPYFT